MDLQEARRSVGRKCVWLLAWAAWACGCDAGMPSGQPPRAELFAGPRANLKTADEIVSVDLASDGTGSLHVAWNAAVEEVAGTLPRHATFYGRGRSSGLDPVMATWSEAARVAETLGPVRVAAAGGELHLICGPTLRHFVAPAAGGAWRQTGELLPAGPRGAIAFDLAIVDGEPLVAYLRRPNTPYEPTERGLEHRQELVVVRFGETSGHEASRVALFGPTMSRPPAPSLLAPGGKRLHLLAGFHEDVRRLEPGRAPAVGESGRVRYFFSEDGGRSWREPAEIKPAVGSFEALRGVDLAAMPSGLLAFVSAHGVYASYSGGGSVWSVAQRINPYESGTAGGTPRSLSVAAASRNGEGRVAWIDERYRRTDGRPWNPLGGVPWSDDTQLWSNNDLFSLPLADVEAMLRGGPAVAPARLTPDLAFARQVRLEALEGGFVVLWSGRRKVSKYLRDAGEPPSIFFRTLPAAEAVGEKTGAP